MSTESIILDSKARRCMSVSAAARVLGVSHGTLLAAIRRGRLRAERQGPRLTLITLRAINGYQVDRGQQAKGRRSAEARR